MTNNRQTLLILGQGDPESANTWSGIPFSLIGQFRANGVDVLSADVESRGPSELLSKLLTAVPNRARWAARHHYGPLAYRLRSSRAVRAVAANRTCPVLQFGAQFCAFAEPSDRYYIYCDSNVFFGSRSPYPKRSSALTADERQAMVDRERRVYTRAQKIFTFSESLRRSFLDDFELPPDRVVTVFAGANFSESVPDPAVARATDSPPTILFVGREFVRKGGEDLIAAFKQLRQVIPEARLVIAGANPKVGEVTGVEIVGFINRSEAGRKQLSSLYRSADVFCMPSRYESFGIVFAEAMLHGLPCIGTTEGAIPEIVEHGRTGWIVPAQNPNALAVALAEALRSPQRRRDMGENGRAKAAAHYTWPCVVSSMCSHMTPD